MRLTRDQGGSTSVVHRSSYCLYLCSDLDVSDDERAETMRPACRTQSAYDRNSSLGAAAARLGSATGQLLPGDALALRVLL